MRGHRGTSGGSTAPAKCLFTCSAECGGGSLLLVQDSTGVYPQNMHTAVIFSPSPSCTDTACPDGPSGWSHLHELCPAHGSFGRKVYPMAQGKKLLQDEPDATACSPCLTKHMWAWECTTHQVLYRRVGSWARTSHHCRVSPHCEPAVITLLALF